MTELNGNGVPKGGVLLGGRQMTITLAKPDYAKLTVLAQANNTGQTAMLEFIVSQGISVGFSQMMVSRLFFILANWVPSFA